MESIMNDLDLYNKKIKEINTLLETEPEKVDEMLESGMCPIPTELLKNVPLGMFHCDLCGEMVVAGMPHPEVGYQLPWHPDDSMAAKDFYETYGLKFPVSEYAKRTSKMQSDDINKKVFDIICKLFDIKEKKVTNIKLELDINQLPILEITYYNDEVNIIDCNEYEITKVKIN